MLENINLLWFAMINSNAGLHGWRLELALFCAEWLILLIPIGLLGLWMSGVGAQREAAVKALAATGLALGINAVIGLMWYHARPFVAGVGRNFLHHAPDSSFPSDHGTIMFTVALVLAASSVPAAKRFGRSLLPLAFVVAWSRVFLGVHWPLDMIGAFGVAVGVTLLFQARLPDAMCALLTTSLGTLYRRVLARPIAWGWLRP